MDPVSQAALGAAWAQPAARRAPIGAATAIGCIAGMAPDIDLLIRSDTDPLLALEFHRHFTHSLVFIPVGAFICAAILYPVFRSRLTAAQCYAFSLLGFASHGLLDACTSYGTMLLWPFSQARVAWDLVSVVDPLFTVPLIALVAAGVARRQPGFAVIGLAWVIAYLGLAFMQGQRATSAAAELAVSRGHRPLRVEVKPSFGNVLLWKSIYEHDGDFYIDAVRVGIGIDVFEGERRERLNVTRDFPWLTPDMLQWRDVERFGRFSDGYLAVDDADASRIVDLRYSLVPNRADGLWGIELDPVKAADAHATYVTMRWRTTDEGRELLDMLFH